MAAEKIERFTLQYDQRLFLVDFDKTILDDLSFGHYGNVLIELLKIHSPQGYEVAYNVPGQLKVFREARQGANLTSVITNTLVVSGNLGLEIMLSPQSH